MRRTIIVLAVWHGWAISALAAPGPTIPPIKDRKVVAVEARRFATQMHGLIEQIAESYVRPVSREDLIQAALVGLYQAARRPLPRNLSRTIRKAVAEATLLRASAQEGPAGEMPPVDPRERLLMRSFEQVGESEALVGRNAVLVCCEAMARILDPYSGIVNAEDQRRSVGLDHESLGLGLEFRDSIAFGPLVVETVQPGSPGQRAGLRPGDTITHVDGDPVERTAPEKMLLVRNQRLVEQVPSVTPRPGASDDPPAPVRPIRVRYERPGVAVPREATLLRERFRPETILGVRRLDDNTWSYMVDEREKLAYLRISTLSRGTSEELRAVLLGLVARKVRGIVLDLRWCPGGYLNESVDTADLFLGAGTIATVKMRNREETVYRSAEAGKFLDIPLVVLVNGETSGGAELIAAALQDHRRATIVGQRTLGKASVQTPLGVGLEGVGFKLTSGTFVRPSDRNLHRFPDSKPSDIWGVAPDEDCRVSRELGKRLEVWWRMHALRPARSLDRLMLDDPRADPQQQAALAVLRRLAARKVRAKDE